MENTYCNVSKILLESNTDKNTVHQYGIAYDMIFNSQFLKFNRLLSVLEIGVSLFGEGSAVSLSQIPFVGKYVGIDNQIYRGLLSSPKVALYTGPQYDAYTYSIIEQIKNKEGLFDIIIDDGPHTWQSQEWFLRNYHEILNPGGVLLCEDIHENHFNELFCIKKELDLYILDLRINNNPHKNEIIALRYK